MLLPRATQPSALFTRLNVNANTFSIRDSRNIEIVWLTEWIDVPFTFSNTSPSLMPARIEGFVKVALVPLPPGPPPLAPLPAPVRCFGDRNPPTTTSPLSSRKKIPRPRSLTGKTTTYSLPGVRFDDDAEQLGRGRAANLGTGGEDRENASLDFADSKRAGNEGGDKEPCRGERGALTGRSPPT